MKSCFQYNSLNEYIMAVCVIHRTRCVVVGTLARAPSFPPERDALSSAEHQHGSCAFTETVREQSGDSWDAVCEGLWVLGLHLVAQTTVIAF